MKTKLLEYQRKTAYLNWKAEVRDIEKNPSKIEYEARLGELNHRIATYEANFIENKL